MKGLLLFFILFGAFATIGNNDDAMPSVNEPEVIEQQVVDPEPEPEPEETFVYGNKDYLVTVESAEAMREENISPAYVKDGLIYTYGNEWGEGGYYTVLSATDLNTGLQVGEDVVFEDDTDYLDLFFAYPVEGGYVGLGECWEGEASVYYFVKYAEDGTIVSKKSLKDVYKMEKAGYFISEAYCDGSYIYVPYQKYDFTNYTGGVLLFDTNFKFIKEISDKEAVRLALGSDNLMYMLDENEETLSVYDTSQKSFNILIDSIPFSFYIYPGYAGKILFGYEDIYSYDIESGDYTKLFNFNDLGLKVDMLDFMFEDADGVITVIYETFNADDFSSEGKFIASITKR